MGNVLGKLLRRTSMAAAVMVPWLASAGDKVSLQVGDQAPDATLTNHEGVEVSLSDLWNESPVVVYFFPKAFTPG